MRIGYSLSSEELDALSMVRYAGMAEESGFDFLMISDHFHPWIDRQGESPFVWSVIGGIATATSRIPLGTAVTCPLIRIHPAVIAHAAATAAAMMPDRFLLGLGTGENLNEHVVGQGWPPARIRRDMLREAIDVIRQPWTGENVNHEGPDYRVENARLYSLPERPPPILVAAAGPKAAALAGETGDGIICTSPDEETIRGFERAGGAGDLRFGQMTVCWAASVEEARRRAFEWWPNAAIGGELGQELALPRHFEQAAAMLTPDQVAAVIPCGPDPEPMVESVRAFANAGFTHVFIHQVGPNQQGFLHFFRTELRPALGALSERAA